MAIRQYGVSVVVPAVKGMIKMWSILSPYDWARILVWKNEHARIPFWFAEVYVVAWLGVLLIGLFSSTSGSVAVPWLVVAIFRLTDLLMGAARIIFIEREEKEDDQGYYIHARNLNRWIVLTLLNVAEIVVAFAILYLRIGDQFGGCGVEDQVTSLYQSIIIITTLGYGDLYPTTCVAKWHVIGELSYSVIFLLLVVPVVFSGVRVREKTSKT